jgi:hypothetical protein
MNTAVADVNQSTTNTNKQQKQTAKEVIAANVQSLIEQLEQGHSEALTAYLTAMGRFHTYSFGNILEIARQKPDATRVAGLYAWNQLGRKVKKGERGIRILAPMIGIRRKKDEEAEKDIRSQNQAVLVGFRTAYVFDVSQTEGKELPEFYERVSGSAGEYRDRLVDFVLAQGIALEFKENIAPAFGMSYGGKIALLPGQSSAEEFSTLVHELAHLCCVKDYVVKGGSGGRRGGPEVIGHNITFPFIAIATRMEWLCRADLAGPTPCAAFHLRYLRGAFCFVL